MNKFINSSKFGDELLFISNLAAQLVAQPAADRASNSALFSFAKNMYAHAHVFLAKKKGEID